MSYPWVLTWHGREVYAVETCENETPAERCRCGTIWAELPGCGGHALIYPEVPHKRGHTDYYYEFRPAGGLWQRIGGSIDLKTAKGSVEEMMHATMPAIPEVKVVVYAASTDVSWSGHVKKLDHGLPDPDEVLNDLRALKQVLGIMKKPARITALTGKQAARAYRHAMAGDPYYAQVEEVRKLAAKHVLVVLDEHGGESHETQSAIKYNRIVSLDDPRYFRRLAAWDIVERTPGWTRRTYENVFRLHGPKMINASGFVKCRGCGHDTGWSNPQGTPLHPWCDEGVMQKVGMESLPTGVAR